MRKGTAPPVGSYVAFKARLSPPLEPLRPGGYDFARDMYFQRLGASGYPATLAVENISAGYHTLAEAFSGWRDSPPHKANMLKNGVTKLGIAATYAPNTKYKVFWTLILAST